MSFKYLNNVPIIIKDGNARIKEINCTKFNICE